jgi:hypothetical protein
VTEREREKTSKIQDYASYDTGTALREPIERKYLKF